MVISAEDTMSGLAGIEYSLNGAVRAEEFSFPVKGGDFRFFPGALDLGKYSDVDYRLTPEEIRFIDACTARKKKVFGVSSPDALSASFSAISPCLIE